jgi:hypothetical protein
MHDSKKEIKEGWQMWVELNDDYVIKTPKIRKEVEKSVSKYLKWIGKPEELKLRVDRAIKDIHRSLHIINQSKIPERYLAYPEFLENGVIKQKKVKVVKEEIIRLINLKREKELHKLIDESVKFFMFLWKYGFHEKTFKITSNFGIDRDQIVLIDFLELEGNKKKVEKQLRKKSWHKYKQMTKDYPREVVDYYIKKADENFTISNLNKLWKTKR